MQDDTSHTALAEAKVAAFVSELGQHKSMRDRHLLRQIFRRAHVQFLKRYEAYAGFPDLFANGNFNCLTATALFSVLLDRFDFSYSLIETNYHIFVVVHLASGDVLLETTDKIGGFITGKEAIRARLAQYRENKLDPARRPGRKIYAYKFLLYQELHAFQIPGLLLFNKAIESFNTGELEASAVYLEKSRSIYDSPRIAELASVIYQAAEEEHDACKREKVLLHVRSCLSAAPAASITSML